MPGLLAPLFLAGLAALAVPVFVHLFDKQQKKPIRFPSLMFLDDIPYRSTNRQRIHHWFLFLLRCLAILLLVFAFARPFITSAKAPSVAGLRGGRDMVILLDRSYSMEYGDRWQQARAAAKELINGMGVADRASVVYFANGASIASNLTSSKSALNAAIDSVNTTAGTTRFDVPLQLAQRIFGDSAQHNREIVLISDYQQSAVGTRTLPPLPEGTQFTQIPIGDGAGPNVMVSHGELRCDTVSGNERAIVAAHIANHDASPSKRIVTLELNGRAIQHIPVELPPNGARRVEFEGIAVPPGLSRGLVRTDEDSLVRDNTFYFVIAPQRPMSVLVVESPSAESQGGVFLTEALRVGTPKVFDVTTVNANRLSAKSLNGVSVVVFNNAPLPGGEVGRELEEFVKGGGGVFVALGPQTNPAGWSAETGALVPRPVARPIDRVQDNGIRLGYVDLGHSIFQVFNTARSGEFSSARFLHYWDITVTPEDRQLARFGDGRAALVERRVGLGHVLVWSSDFDGRWNDMPLQPVFLPFLRQAIKYTAGTPKEYTWMTVGSVLNPEILFGERKATVTPTSNAERAEAIRNTQYVAVAPSGAQKRFGPFDPPTLDEQGIYEITRSGLAGAATRQVAANIDPAESDLTQLDTAFVRATMTPVSSSGVSAQTKSAEEMQPADWENRQRFWWFLLVTMLVLLSAETFLSNRLSRSAR